MQRCLLVLVLFIDFGLCRFMSEERQWNEDDSRLHCTELCSKSCQNCTEPYKCADLEYKCPGITGTENDCPADETCVPVGCQCKQFWIW